MPARLLGVRLVQRYEVAPADIAAVRLDQELSQQREGERVTLHVAGERLALLRSPSYAELVEQARSRFL